MKFEENILIQVTFPGIRRERDTMSAGIVTSIPKFNALLQKKLIFCSVKAPELLRKNLFMSLRSENYM